MDDDLIFELIGGAPRKRGRPKKSSSYGGKKRRRRSSTSRSTAKAKRRSSRRRNPRQTLVNEILRGAKIAAGMAISAKLQEMIQDQIPAGIDPTIQSLLVAVLGAFMKTRVRKAQWGDFLDGVIAGGIAKALARQLSISLSGQYDRYPFRNRAGFNWNTPSLPAQGRRTIRSVV